MTTTTTPDVIRAAVEAGIPAMAGQHADWMRRKITQFSALPRGEQINLSASRSCEGGAYRAVRGFMGCDDAALLRYATRIATESAEETIAKLVKKLGTLTEAAITNRDAGQFTLIGMLGARRVCVEQQRVFKFSSKGTPFNQWPARIYVDGKFTPEAAFAKLS